MKTVFKAVLLLLTSWGIVRSQGTVEQTSFVSGSLGISRSVNVYLPEGYDPCESTHYPVIYFLHCAGCDHTSYPEIYGIVDELIHDGTLSPVILVKPDGSASPYLGPSYTNSELYGDFEDFIVYDLIEFIDSHYKSISIPQRRCLMGHSMGGYGSMKLALKHADVYTGIAAHSGTLDLNVGLSLWAVHVLDENGSSPPYSYSPSAGTFTSAMFTWAGAFSPNVGNPPTYVDFPLDSDGNVIETVLARWQPHNPTWLAAQVPAASSPSIYFDCGTSDEYECYPMNAAFADSLDVLGLTYEFRSYPGNHVNRLTERFLISLVFLDSLMHSEPAAFLQPYFNAEPMTGHAPLEVQFTNVSYSNQSITSWAWDFDADGTPDSEEEHPRWTFYEPGVYAISLKVSTDSLSRTKVCEDYVRVFDGESALQFGSVGSYAVCASTPALNLTETLTIEAWINPSGWGGTPGLGFGRVVDKHRFAVFLLGSHPAFNDHSVAVQLQHIDNTVSLSVTPEGSIVLGGWQHVAVTYDGRTSEVKVYIDGVEQVLSQTVPPSGSIAENSTDDVVIGNDASRGFSFDGIIDEARLWGGVRTGEEIANTMHFYLVGEEAGLVGYWRMNEGNGDIAADHSGHGHDAVVGDAMWVQGVHVSPVSADGDDDGFFDSEDNCPDVYNPGQEDGDGDGVGDACDNCPVGGNPDQADADRDDIGDMCDSCTDTDGDGYGDPGYAANTCDEDNCPRVSNPDQAEVERGDINCEGGINVLDVLAVVNHILGTAPLVGDPLHRADCNGDGRVNVVDALGIVNVILGIAPECPGDG